jgi:heme O synthase-like polyprenyltransferase
MTGIVKGVSKQALIILTPLCFICLFFAGWRFAFSVAVGGLVGVGNLSGIAWSVTALIGTEKPQAKMVFLSTFKLFIIFSILLILAILRLINPWGLLAGFTVVMVLIIKEGLFAAKRGD